MMIASNAVMAIEAKVRIMDLTHIKGVRDNQVVGYGIVVGLPGTGDNSRSTQITNKMLLMNLGTVIEQENYIQKGSSAAVIVTATIPPFSKNGDKSAYEELFSWKKKQKEYAERMFLGAKEK